jgi:hypothetical protein
MIGAEVRQVLQGYPANLLPRACRRPRMQRIRQTGLTP